MPSRRAIQTGTAHETENRNNPEDELDQMDRQAGTLAHQAPASRDDMQVCEFVSDERGIRQHPAQLHIYMDPADTAELINSTSQAQRRNSECGTTASWTSTRSTPGSR